MKKIQNIIQSIVIVSMAFYLSSCASPGKDVLPQSKGASMVDVYHQETGTAQETETAYSSEAGELEPIDPDLIDPEQAQPETAANPYTKVAIRKVVHVNEIVGDASDYYKPVENIRMRIYVFPHRIYNEDGEESIVPSYYTYYPLYSHQHYYLPNEAI